MIKRFYLRKGNAVKKVWAYLKGTMKPIFFFKIIIMNIENISALMGQLQSLGFENAGYPLLKRLSFKPENFILSQKIEKSKDKLSFQLFFEKEVSKGMYVLLYYDATLQKEAPIIDGDINGISAAILEKSMTEIDWKSALDFVTKKQLNLEDKTSWEKEQNVHAF